jgi:cytochrome oxidase Cu insertion factor (SCO1/SenC/PrrC family)
MPARFRLAAALLVAVAAALPAQPPAKSAPKARPREGSLKVGDTAPALAADELATGQAVKLAELRGRPTVLIFGSCT